MKVSGDKLCYQQSPTFSLIAIVVLSFFLFISWPAQAKFSFHGFGYASYLFSALIFWFLLTLLPFYRRVCISSECIEMRYFFCRCKFEWKDITEFRIVLFGFLHYLSIQGDKKERNIDAFMRLLGIKRMLSNTFSSPSSVPTFDFKCALNELRQRIQNGEIADAQRIQTFLKQFLSEQKSSRKELKKSKALYNKPYVIRTFSIFWSRYIGAFTCAWSVAIFMFLYSHPVKLSSWHLIETTGLFLLGVLLLLIARVIVYNPEIKMAYLGVSFGKKILTLVPMASNVTSIKLIRTFVRTFSKSGVGYSKYDLYLANPDDNRVHIRRFWLSYRAEKVGKRLALAFNLAYEQKEKFGLSARLSDWFAQVLYLIVAAIPTVLIGSVIMGN